MESFPTENKETNRSDISQNTNLKVFNGGFSENNDNNNLLKKLNKNQNKPQFLASMPIESISKKPCIDIMSFGNNDLLNKYSNENGVVKNEEEDLNTSKNSKNSKNSGQSKKSIRTLSVNDPIETTIQNNFITTEGIYNEDNDISLSSENYFTKIHKEKNKNEENSPKKEEIKGIQTMKNNKKIVNNFTISTIEKGVALVVAENDSIFTLPTFLLPRGVRSGLNYNFVISQEMTKQENEKEIKKLQQKFIKEQKEEKTS